MSREIIIALLDKYFEFHYAGYPTFIENAAYSLLNDWLALTGGVAYNSNCCSYNYLEQLSLMAYLA